MTALQDTVANQLRPDLRTDRAREFAACTSRILARMRVDAETAPRLQESHLSHWRSLNSPAPATAAGDDRGWSYHVNRACLALQNPGGNESMGSTQTGSGTDRALWFRNTVLAARDFLEAYEQAVRDAVPGAREIETGGDEQRVRLSQYLESRFPDLPQNCVRWLRTVPGGRGKETSLFELAPNGILPTRLVLRRDLAVSITGSKAYAEFDLLTAMVALGLPVPKPVLAEKDASYLGGSFIIMTEIENAKCGGELFAELNDLSKLSKQFAPDLVRALAALHGVREHPSGTELAGHASDGDDPTDTVRGFQRMFDATVNKPPFHLSTLLGFQWLLANPIVGVRPRRLVHGDMGLHNLLVRDGELAAILDWELAHIGDPAEDIAYCWSYLLRHLMSWEDFQRLYVESGGSQTACDARVVAWYSVWAHTRNSVYVAFHYDLVATGQRLDIEAVNAGIDFFARTQLYIARELAEALESSGGSAG